MGVDGLRHASRRAREETAWRFDRLRPGVTPDGPGWSVPKERRETGKDHLHAAISTLRKVGRGSIMLQSTVASKVRARTRWHAAFFAVRLTLAAVP